MMMLPAFTIACMSVLTLFPAHEALNCRVEGADHQWSCFVGFPDNSSIDDRSWRYGAHNRACAPWLAKAVREQIRRGVVGIGDGDSITRPLIWFGPGH